MKLVAFAVVFLSATAALAQSGQQVDGYVRKDGTYVPPHYRSAPDDTRMNNYTSEPNANPYTGERGTRDPYQQHYEPYKPYKPSR